MSILLLTALASFAGQTNDAKTEAILKRMKNPDLQLNASAQGREFWLAVPLNTGKDQPTLNLEFYVTSSYNTLVTLEVPGSGFVVSKKLEALKVVTFTTKDATASFDWEVVSSQIADNRGVHIYADKPISVYCLNGKDLTSDGYLGLPISAWGTDYIHCAYYDFNEYRPLAAGFIIVASEDKTTVQVKLAGRGKDIAKTRSGSKIGAVLEFNLDRGQVYCVVGDATTRGSFDLTGSKIHADKPIGLISYHERTFIPSNVQTNGRDHICEMLPPISAWGKKYVTVEFKRDNHGDFFRVVASQNNTKWSMQYYDKMSGVLLGQRNGKLNAGEFYEDFDSWAGNSAIEGFRGVSVWQADKPFLLMQYQYSADWDKGSNFDPDMVVVTPYEQFLKATLFQTPTNPAFVDNWFNYIVEGDPTDTNSVKLKSLVIDGDTAYKSFPQLLLNRIPTTNLYWGFRSMSPGPHIVTSETKFGGYVYGFGAFNGYTWPAALATKSLEDLDTLPPQLTFTDECGDYHYTSTEVRNFGVPPDTVQIDQGIFEISLVDSVSYNYELKLLTADKIIPLPKVTEFKFDILVKDKTKDAFAIVIVMDRAGNYTLDTVSYVADKITLNPAIVQFGKVRVGKTKQLTVQLKNPNARDIKIKKLTLLKKKEFTIISGDAPPEFVIAAKDSHAVVVSYTPIKEGLSDVDKDIDIDSILAETECAKFSFPVKGRGVVPCADVEPLWLAPITAIGDTIRKESISPGLYIRNKGTDTLTVTNILGVQQPFFVENPTPKFPFQIAPGGQVYFSSIGYVPTKLTIDTLKVTFETDGGGVTCNEVSTWIGQGKAPGPKITSYDWRERRVLTVNNSTIEVSNLGTSDLNLVGWHYSTPGDANFSATTQSKFSATAPFLLRANNATKVVFDVVYTPQGEATHHNSIIPEFKEVVPQIEGTLDGIGILPKIAPLGWVFPDSTLVGNTYPVPGKVVVRNPSTSAVLNVKTFGIRAGGNTADFDFTPAQLPASFVIGKADSVVFPVTFSPKAIGQRKVTIDMTSDAAPGPEVDPTVSHSVDVVGVGYKVNNTFPRISVGSIDYGTVLTCDNPTKQFVIGNPGGTAPLVISSYAKVGADAANFIVSMPTLPITIPPNGTVPVDVMFLPNAIRTYNAEVLIYSDADTLDFPLALRTATLTGVGKIVPVDFALTVTGAKAITPGDPKDFVLSATGGAFNDALIKDFVAEIQYDQKLLDFRGVDFVGAYKSAWTFGTPTHVGTGANHKLVLTASGNFSIPSTGPIAELHFNTLLADTLYYPVGLNVQTPKVAACVIPKSIGDQISIQGCFINARLVSPTGSKYALTTISPNPSGNDVITVDYSVGLNSHTTFELYNTLGERVAVLMDKVLSPGDYQARMGIANIPAGVYSCRMISGQFSASQMITITK